MSPHAPPHLAKIAPVLLAGEDVRWMGKPHVAWLLMLDTIAALGSFAALFIITSLFSDLPPHLKSSISVFAALAGVSILHFLVGMRTYVITDQRLLIITSFSNDVHDSCDLGEIESISHMKLGNSLQIIRRNRKPIRLWALGDRNAVEQALLRE